MPELLSLYAANVGGTAIGEIHFVGHVHNKHFKNYENKSIMLKTTDLALVKTEDGFKVYATAYFTVEGTIGPIKMYQDAV